MIYALVDQAQRPVYVGRTGKGLETRLGWHRRSRRAQWLKACNAELAAWLERNDPAGIVLDEVPEDCDLWEAERTWIAKLADDGPLLNILGNPYRKRRGGPASAVAA